MKKEIILRKNIYNGKPHKLVYTGTGQVWEFVAAEPWMPIYLNYWNEEGREREIISLDSDGFGYPACIGDRVDDYIIEAIIESDDKFLFFLKHINTL